MPQLTIRQLILPVLAVAVLATACGARAATPPTTAAPHIPSVGSAPAPSDAGSTSPSADAGGSPDSGPQAAFTPVPDASQGPDTGAATAAGDVPDNAVFLKYTSAAWQFSIQYVEGWQVTTATDGVTIRDKDSSETVTVVPLPSDVAAYVTDTDRPALQAIQGFKLVKQDKVKVGSATLIHLVYHALAAPDAVTGKQVPSTIDRFYAPGPALAIVSLSTPNGVDNVDAFRQMIESLKWS